MIIGLLLNCVKAGSTLTYSLFASVEAPPLLFKVTDPLAYSEPYTNILRSPTNPAAAQVDV